MWQRGAAWTPPRQVLLIDSLLRGMDIPKIYLRQNRNSAAFDWEAVDGQQRLRAIWSFREGHLQLTAREHLQPVDGSPIDGLTYPELSKTLRDRFDAFEVSIAQILEGSNDEVTALFSRLQMGVPLNPAELRNAMLVPVRHAIDTIATSHPFFINSKIRGARHKHQDYLTNIFAWTAFKGDSNIKAPDLRRLYASLGPDRTDEIMEICAALNDALDVLTTVNAITNGSITQKWIFVDLMWLVMCAQADGGTVDPIKVATAYQAFESRRREFNSHAEDLINARRVPVLDRQLYNYIQAFRTEGARRDHVNERAQAIRAFFPDILVEAQ